MQSELIMNIQAMLRRLHEHPESDDIMEEIEQQCKLYQAGIKQYMKERHNLVSRSDYTEYLLDFEKKLMDTVNQHKDICLQSIENRIRSRTSEE